jgi:peptidoglycan hydrolase FlgJ
MSQIAGVTPGKGPMPSPAERLKKTALQLEGVFVQRLFAAMRDTVPTDGLMSQSTGESTFTQLLDEKFSEQVPKQWNGQHSLAQALYRQLSQRLASQAADSTGSEPK